MRLSVFWSALLTLTLSGLTHLPTQADVSITYTSGYGRSSFSYITGYPVVYNTWQPGGTVVYVTPPSDARFLPCPAYSFGGYPRSYLYVPPAAYTGMSWGPPVVVTSPPSMYGYGTAMTTVTTTPMVGLTNRVILDTGGYSRNQGYTNHSATKDQAVVSPQIQKTEPTPAPESLLAVEKLDNRRILVTWNAQDTQITSAVFYTGDLFQAPIETTRVSQPPFQSVLLMGGNVRQVGATISYKDGSQTTRWIPYTSLSR